MNEIAEKYLPIGSVVLLKGGEKKIMITGFASISPDTGDKIFDYSGCIFPEGFISYNQVCVFDHSQIDKIFYKGLEDEEQKKFNDLLNKKMFELKNDK